MSDKVAVVTGANKGIGLAVVKALCERFPGTVYLTSRDAARGEAAAAELTRRGLRPRHHTLDVTDRGSVAAFADHIRKTHGGIDILINNAGIGAIITSTYKENEDIINTNYRSILTMQELIYPLIRENGRVVNISSSCGHLSNIRNKYWIERLSKKNLTVADVNEFVDWYLKAVKNETFNMDDLAEATCAAYRIAKVALSAITMVQQKELEPRNIAVNSMHPGVVRTDMTWNRGHFNTDEAAKTIIYLALEAPQSLKGAYVWHDGKVLDWYDYKADYFFKAEELLKNSFLFVISLKFFSLLSSLCDFSNNKLKNFFT